MSRIPTVRARMPKKAHGKSCPPLKINAPPDLPPLLGPVFKGAQAPICHGGASTPDHLQPLASSADPSLKRGLEHSASPSALSHAHTLPWRPLYPPTWFQGGCPRRQCTWRSYTVILVRTTRPHKPKKKPKKQQQMTVREGVREKGKVQTLSPQL